MKFKFLPENFSRSENAPPFETRKIRQFEVERIFLKNKKMLDHFFVIQRQRSFVDTFLFSANSSGVQTCAKNKGLPLLSQREPFPTIKNHPADTPAEILRLLMGRDFAVFNLNEIGLRRFAFPFQTPKIQRTRRETAFAPKNAVFTLKIIDVLPQKVKDGVAPNYQRYMPKK